MESIYQNAITQVEQGSRFAVNFKNRSLTVDGKKLIDNGVYKGELGVPETDDTVGEITHLYERYQHSLPSERSERKKRHYFFAIPEHKLSDEDMMFGEPREVAQIKLELFVLGSILNGTLKWEDFPSEGESACQWFWRSPLNRDLIILKEWITK